MADFYKNAYLVGIFATNRPTINKDKHTGMISYDDAENKMNDW